LAKFSTVVWQNSAVSELEKLNGEFVCRALCDSNFLLGAKSLVKSALAPVDFSGWQNTLL